VRKMS